MSSVGVISTVAVPSPVSTSFNPSHFHAGEGACSASPSPPSGERSIGPILNAASRVGLGRGALLGIRRLLTALSLRDRHAGRRRPSHPPALLVQHLGPAEHQRFT